MNVIRLAGMAGKGEGYWRPERIINHRPIVHQVGHKKVQKFKYKFPIKVA